MTMLFFHCYALLCFIGWDGKSLALCSPTVMFIRDVEPLNIVVYYLFDVFLFLFVGLRWMLAWPMGILSVGVCGLVLL